MRNFLYLTGILLLLIPLRTMSQELSATETEMLFDGKNKNTLVVTLEGNVDDLKEKWKKHIKEEFRIDLKGRKDLLEAKEAALYPVTDMRGDFITFFYPENNNVKMAIVYALGYDVYLNSQQYPEEFAKLKRVTNEFIYDYYDEYFKIKLKEEEKALKKLKKDKRKKEKTVTSLKKRIARNEKKVSKDETKAQPLNQANEQLTKDAEIASNDVERLQQQVIGKEKNIAEIKSKLDNVRAIRSQN